MSKTERKVLKIRTKVKLIPSETAKRMKGKTYRLWFDAYRSFGTGPLTVTGNNRGYCKVRTRRFWNLWLFPVTGKIHRLLVEPV